MNPALRQLTALLAVDLVDLPEGYVIAFKRGGKYAHARGDAECLFIETSSNVDLTGELQLSPDDEASLREKGWQAPDAPGVPGWFHEFPWPLSGTAALTASEMLIDVIEQFPESAGKPLEVEAFDLRTDEPLDLESVRRIRAACQGQ